jgi:multidrug efflux pump subunit AcrA (membrane-fusion protein)
LDKKELLMSARGRLPLAAAGAVVLLLLVVPWSRRTLATDVNLEPLSRAQIQAPREGIVSEVLVHEGDRVNAGQPLFRLTSAATAQEGQRLTAEREMAQEESRIGRQSANAALVYQADRRSSSVQEALRATRVHQEELIVRSPISGRVLSPRPEDLAGRYVIEGASLAEVGDCRQMVADIGISERFLERLHTGAPVAALVQTRLARPAHGSVVRISSATMEQPATASAGREPAIPSARPDRFVASALFDNPDGLLLPGAAAKIKVYGVREAYAVRAWRGLWRWIRTLFW